MLMPERLKTILTIAGSDSCAGAGIQADIKAASYFGIYATTAVTAVTAQNSGAVSKVMALPPDMLRSQIEAVVEDQCPDAVKIGMTGSLANCEVICEMAEGCLKDVPIVIDPVISATSGAMLSGDKEKLIDFYINHLLPLATVVTPNIPEAEMILGRPIHISNTSAQSEVAARMPDKLGCQSVVLKGGHTDGKRVWDVFVEYTFDGDLSFANHYFQRLMCPNLHGTGCTYSTMMASAIAEGHSLAVAFRLASKLTHDFIERSCGYSFGDHNNGPLNIFDFKTENNN